MSEKSSPAPSDKSGAKKAAVPAAGTKTSKWPLVATVGVAAVLAIAAFVLVGKKGGGDALAVAASAPAGASGTEVVLPAAQFDDGQARFYKLDARGITVRYYVVKGSDGVIHAAYDACDACWASGKGYKQAGDVMICENCRRSFAINEIGQQHGGCNPAALKSEVRDGKVVIRVADIQAGRRYFDLPKGG